MMTTLGNGPGPDGVPNLPWAPTYAGICAGSVGGGGRAIAFSLRVACGRQALHAENAITIRPTRPRVFSVGPTDSRFSATRDGEGFTAVLYSPQRPGIVNVNVEATPTWLFP